MIDLKLSFTGAFCGSFLSLQSTPIAIFAPSTVLLADAVSCPSSPSTTAVGLLVQLCVSLSAKGASITDCRDGEGTVVRGETVWSQHEFGKHSPSQLALALHPHLSVVDLMF